MTLRYYINVAVEEAVRFNNDLRALPVFWRALRRSWPFENHDERVAEAAMSVGMSYMDRVSYADAKARGEVL